jgi:membrane peptidoglycan carboxypeptidase
VVDKPIAIGNYEPENFGHRYRGAISVRQAFASSINTVAVRLSEAVGRDAVIGAARDLGITTPLEPAPSLALGSFEVSLLELTSAYCAVAAGAYPVKPWAITGFGGVDGQALPPQDSGLWRLEEQEDLKTLLNGTVRYGSGRRAQLPIAAYGKTGTSQNYRDAWFIGFAGNLVVGVWVGNDDSSSMKRVTGGSLPAQIWKTFMSEAIRSDEHFESDLPEIAAFPRRAHPSYNSVKLVADLETQSQSQPAAFSKSRISKKIQDRDALLRDRWKSRWAASRGGRNRKNAGGFMEHLFR